MEGWRQWAAATFGAVTLAALGVGAVLVVRAPIDESVGPIQKLIYLHLPAAANTLLSALVVCIAGVGYIGGRRQAWDDLGHAAAIVTVLNATVLLVTGVFWAKVCWGLWWTWGPHFSLSLLLWLLYILYLVLRVRIRSPQQRALVTAVYGIVAFLDVPLLYLSLKLLPDPHPTVAGLTPAMYPALIAGFVGITLLSALMLSARFALAGATHSSAGKAVPS